MQRALAFRISQRGAKVGVDLDRDVDAIIRRAEAEEDAGREDAPVIQVC